MTTDKITSIADTEQIKSLAELKKKRRPIHYCEDCDSLISNTGCHSADHSIRVIWVIDEEHINSFEAGVRERAKKLEKEPILHNFNFPDIRANELRRLLEGEKG